MKRDVMTGNAVFEYRDTAVLSVTVADAPIVVTSAEIEVQLASTLERVGLRPGLLESLAGIVERRWWPTDVSFADAAAMAGAKAIAESGIDPSQIGLLIDTSVSRSHLEPSAAVDVHEQLGLGTHCMNFDVGNACLGFLNGMHLAATLIDSGQIDYALVVDGEGTRHTQEMTIQRLQNKDSTRSEVIAQFATLTLGSGAAAMVLGRASLHSEGHRMIGGVTRAATQYNKLCVGDLDGMITDSSRLLNAGVELAVDTWNGAKARFDWSNMDAYFIHQVSKVYTDAITSALGIDPARTPVIFPTRGNIGPASVPFTLAANQADLVAGQRIALMGIGSGLNSAIIEIAW
jgi:3-oxoacyl-[acyl-carrier-protein] synthase III